MSRASRGESNLQADMGIASPPAAARNVTVENFLPQQRWIVGGQLVGNYPLLSLETLALPTGVVSLSA